MRTKHFGIIHTNIYKQSAPGTGVARARYIEAYGKGDTISPEARATQTAAYIEGVASSDAERVVFCYSNIADNYTSRIDFFRKFDAEATFRGDATIELDIRGYEHEWSALAHERALQRDIERAYSLAQAGNGTARLVLNTTESAKRFSKTKKHAKLFSQTLKVSCPANQLTMCSLIFSLPHELSAAGHVAVTKNICKIFEDRGLPFQAVIHEPVVNKNDHRNVHVHLNYLPFQVAFDEISQKWSFEKETYLSECRHKRERRIADLIRHPDTKADQKWVASLKTQMCQLTNFQLESEGLAPRFTTLSNAERHIHGAEKPLGPAAYAAMQQGLRSDASIAAACVEWKKLAEQKAQSKSNATLRALLMAAAQRNVPEKEALARASEIAELRAVIELIKTKKREISSGRQFVRTAQNNVIATAKKVTRKTDLALTLLKTCSDAEEYERVVLAKLDKLKNAAKQRMKNGVRRLFDELGQTSLADGVAVATSSRIQLLNQAKVGRLFHEPARKFGLELNRRRGGEASLPMASAIQAAPASPTQIDPSRAVPGAESKAKHKIQQDLGLQL